MANKINLIFIDVRGLGKNYGIRSYRDSLLSNISDTNTFNIVYVSIEYTNSSGVKIQNKSKKRNYKHLYISLPLSLTLRPDGNEYDSISERIKSKICFAIIQEATKANTGIVHLNSSGDKGLAIVAKSKGFKVVGTQHHELYVKQENANEDFNSTTSIVGNNNIYFQNLDACIFLTEETRKRAIFHYQVPTAMTTTIYNGSRIVHPISESERSTRRTRLGFNEDDFLILYVGRIERTKGINELVSAFSIFSTTHVAAKLIIAGGGDYGLACNLSFSKIGRIHLTGYISKDQLSDLYQISDLGILPSYSEQSSFAVLEMLSNGLPVIVSDISGFEIFEDDVHVLKAKINRNELENVEGVNIDSLVDCLKVIYSDKDLSLNLVRNGQLLIESKLSVESMVDKTCAVYQQLIN